MHCFGLPRTDQLSNDPQDPNRPHSLKPPHIYSFDRVFPPDTSQSSFFTTTTFPLVEKLLHGENGLLFAYGVSNSGKSYTISGANTHTAEDRGVLPRAVDVVFNSIIGMESTANVSQAFFPECQLTLCSRYLAQMYRSGRCRICGWKGGGVQHNV